VFVIASEGMRPYGNDYRDHVDTVSGSLALGSRWMSRATYLRRDSVRIVPGGSARRIMPIGSGIRAWRCSRSPGLLLIAGDSTGQGRMLLGSEGRRAVGAVPPR
jgi:hypothetical protein